MKIKNDVTILVSSCDKYEDAWEPFFRLLKIQWNDCPYDIVLSTETKQYKCDFWNVRTINSPSQKVLSWSSRLKYTLEQIDTEYVLFFLEDFFLLEKVRDDIFYKALELIKSDERIGLISFNKRRFNSHFPETTYYENCFKELRSNVNGRTNVLVGLWRKEYYLKLICGEENPWEYEKNSNIRSKFAGYKILTQDYNCSPATFRYCMNPADGYGITQGKWLSKNRELFESHGVLNVNYENLGVIEEKITYEDIQDNSIQNGKNRLVQQKQLLKQEKLYVRFKEYLYMLYKSLKKTKFFKKMDYYKVCMKYFFYYKLKK